MNNFRLERLQEENAKHKKQIAELHAVIIRTMDYLEVLPNEFAQITRRVVGLREDLKSHLNLPPWWKPDAQVDPSEKPPKPS